MAKQVKILTFALKDQAIIKHNETYIAQLLDQGWEIATAGGSGASNQPGDDMMGFVILVKK